MTNCYCMNPLGYSDCLEKGCLSERKSPSWPTEMVPPSKEVFKMKYLENRTSEFLNDVAEEIKKARNKFPVNDVQMIALTEEVGELAQALMDKPWEEVWKEAVQVATMALRVAVEGDNSVVELRRRKGL